MTAICIFTQFVLTAICILNTICISKGNNFDRDHPDYERQVKYQKLQLHIDNLLVERVINIWSFRHSVDSTLHKLQTLRKLWHKHNLFVWKFGIQVMLDSLDLKIYEDNEKRDKKQRTDFIYQVNFEPGEGQNCIQYIRLHRPLNQSLWLLKLIRHFQKLYHHISIKSLKVDLFKDLIGKIKEIMSKKTGEEQVLEIGSASSVTDDKYTEWNELLCKIIILASFTKINQAEF